MGNRRRWSDEEWAEEARYIDRLGEPGPNFNSDPACMLEYIDMQLRFCVQDLGPHHIWTTVIRAKSDLLAFDD